MGNKVSICEPDSDNLNAFLSKQEQLYKWRASHNAKGYLPRVFFQNVEIERQQEELGKLLTEVGSGNLVDWDRVKKSMKTKSGQEKIIVVFEKYACTLADVQELTVSELLYVGNCLLSAYETLGQVYGEIIVNRRCCFVTERGEVRVWVNKSPKCNSLDRSMNAQIILVSDHPSITNKIIDELQQLSSSNITNTGFFDFIRKSVNSQGLRQEQAFGELARIFYKYSNLHRIAPSRSINHQRRSHFTNKNSLSAVTVNIPSKKQQTTKGHIRANSFDRSGQRHSTLKEHLHSEHRTVTTVFNKRQQQVKNIQPLTPNYSSKHTGFQQISSGIRTSSTSSTKTKPSQILQKTAKPTISNLVTPKRPIHQSSLVKVSQNSKESTVRMSIPSQEISGCLLTEKTESRVRNAVTKSRQSVKLPSVAVLLDQEPFQPEIKTSIVQLGETPSAINTSNKENKALTCHQMRVQQLSNHSLKPPKEGEQRAWMTAKTIQRLVGSNHAEDSLVHSMGSSEEQILSHYSGMLSRFGREASEKYTTSIQY